MARKSKPLTRKSIQLSEQEWALLALLAERETTGSVSRLVRTAVQIYLAEQGLVATGPQKVPA